MRLKLWARSRNGLHPRTGISILAICHMARASESGSYTELLIWDCATRLRGPMFGGSNRPATDRSFRVASLVVWARPGQRSSS